MCDHRCSGNCRRVGCNCECGEFHRLEARVFNPAQEAMIERMYCYGTDCDEDRCRCHDEEMSEVEPAQNKNQMKEPEKEMVDTANDRYRKIARFSENGQRISRMKRAWRVVRECQEKSGPVVHVDYFFSEANANRFIQMAKEHAAGR